MNLLGDVLDQIVSAAIPSIDFGLVENYTNQDGEISRVYWRHDPSKNKYKYVIIILAPDHDTPRGPFLKPLGNCFDRIGGNTLNWLFLINPGRESPVKKNVYCPLHDNRYIIEYFEHLKSRGYNIIVCGICAGGYRAMSVAIERPHLVKACIGIHCPLDPTAFFKSLEKNKPLVSRCLCMLAWKKISKSYPTLKQPSAELSGPAWYDYVDREYYRSSDKNRHRLIKPRRIKRSRVPMLWILSKSDNVLNFEEQPVDDYQKIDNFEICVDSTGEHCGFFNDTTHPMLRKTLDFIHHHIR